MQSYHKNFITAVKLLTQETGLGSLRQIAPQLKIPLASLYKIMDGSNPPTVEQCIIVLKKGRFTANWMFMNIGKPREEVAVKRYA